MIRFSIPSPSQAEWHLGPFPLRAYAIAIILGIVVAWWLMDRRYRKKGGPEDVSVDIAIWAVIFGILGGRLYHVITDYQLYFGQGKNPWRAFFVWEGGLGIWGAIGLGGVGVFIAMRKRGLRMLPMADALAPALLIAQAMGRFGNYFNQELYGKPTDVPWALEIDPAHLVDGYPVGTTFHPTFLYESLWRLAGAGLSFSRSASIWWQDTSSLSTAWCTRLVGSGSKCCELITHITFWDFVSMCGLRSSYSVSPRWHSWSSANCTGSIPSATIFG